MAGPGTVLPTRAAVVAARDEFLRWQCRIRQLSVRRDGGRPSAGMIPAAYCEGEKAPAVRPVTVLNRAPEHDVTAEFRHMHRCTMDPRERREAALALLAGTYFQHPERFTDRLTAVFPPASKTAARLAASTSCNLRFAQFGQGFDIACAARSLPPRDPLREATIWFVGLFLPAVPTDCEALVFEPNWGAGWEA